MSLNMNSVAAGCKMSWSLRHKIRKSASLLSPVSPSRLTEEMLKIINSGHAYDIVSEALDTDLYMSLQPSATEFMFSDKNFEKSYMQNLKRLDALNVVEKEARLGKKLVFLIKDFILTLTDWKKEIEKKSSAGELYIKTWDQCRHFVLPMNPQRTELEFAIRSALREIGVNIRLPKADSAGESKEGSRKPRRRRRRARNPQIREESDAL